MKTWKKLKKNGLRNTIIGFSLIVGLLVSWSMFGEAFTSDVSTILIAILFIVLVMFGFRRWNDI